MTGKRRFELVEGSSSKFWQVAWSDDAYTVTYGRIGSAGVSKETKCSSSEQVEAEVNKLIREKTKKGYVEEGGEAGFRPPPHYPSFANLERFRNYKVVEFNPNSDGEESESGRRGFKALRELDKYAFAVASTYDDAYEGFLAKVDALLADPKIGELKALVIGAWQGSDYLEEGPTALYEKLAAAGPRLKSLTGLFVGDIAQEEQEISWIHQGDLGPVLKAIPTLEEVVIRGGEGLRLKDLKHDHLKSLTLQAGGLGEETLQDVVAAKLPELQVLTLWLGDDNYGAAENLDSLAPLFAGKCFPKLEHLGLQNSYQQDAVATALGESKIVSRLKGLDLSMGVLTDAGAEALLKHPDILKLKWLNLRHHYLLEAMTAKMRKLGIEVNVGDRKLGEWDGDKLEGYVEVSE